jgi:hypothetical protein
MPMMGEPQALATSVGEHLVQALSTEEQVTALSLVLDDRESQVQVWVVLKDASDAAQLRALETLEEVEEMFAEEVVMTFQFVESLDAVRAQRAAVPAYSYA